MIIKFFQTLWHYIDAICFLAASGFAVWGCFLIGKIPGIFSIAVVLILIGLATEYLSQPRQWGEVQ